MSGHHHHHHHDHESENIKVAFFLNLGFTVVEIVGGIMTNSVAILSDAIHDLGDSLSLGLAWYLQKFSNRKRTRKYSYGYRRFSVLGAIITSLVLVVGSAFIIHEAVGRLMEPQEPKAGGMIGLAVLGVVVNGAAVLRLRKGDSLNAKVVSLHLMEDVLGWVAVLIGALVMYFFDVPILDPILSLAIAAFVLFNVYRNLKETLEVVMQGVPAGVAEKALDEYLSGLSGVKEYHDLHVWTMDGIYHVLTVHLVLENDMTVSQTEALKSQVKAGLAPMGIEHVTLEMELPGEHCGQGEV